MSHLRLSLLLAAIAASFALHSHAETITYRIVQYNADAGDYVLAAHGQRPVGSYALFENEYGATRGNRYNQIPRNREATLYLVGWEGCVVHSVTLAMCSNNTSGSAALTVTAGDEELFAMKAQAFDAPEWFGHWLSKDLQTYADITKDMTRLVAVPEKAELAINVKGGTAEGSVYLDAVTIDYTPVPDIATESPLGWVFEKLEAKSTIADGDVIMLYRSGDAAGDIDGMHTSHYLDAIGISSTGNVAEPFIEMFTLGATPDGFWTLTNQYGQRLGASAAQNLQWDEGVTTWDITLGYNGATIASTNSKYGTLRYNAPAGSYPRFWNYTSNSLPLPYIYRRTRQQQPVAINSLQLPAERNVDLADADTLLIRPQLTPATATDRRLFWQSSDEAVATVKSGVVFPHNAGTTIVTATTADGTVSAATLVTVTDLITSVPNAPLSPLMPPTTYSLNGYPVPDPTRPGIYLNNHRIYYRKR